MHFNRLKKIFDKHKLKNSPKKDKYSFLLRIKYLNIHMCKSFILKLAAVHSFVHMSLSRSLIITRSFSFQIIIIVQKKQKVCGRFLTLVSIDFLFKTYIESVMKTNTFIIVKRESMASSVKHNAQWGCICSLTIEFLIYKLYYGEFLCKKTELFCNSL